VTQEFSRQAFVRAALGAIAAGALGSCRPKAPAAPLNPSSTSSPPSGPVDWSALDDAIDGGVILPSNGEYATAKTVFNACFADSTPAAVVAAKSPADVQKAVAFAAKNDIRIAARCGGHSYIGASAANGAMVIDLRRLPGGVSYDDGSGLATVSAAADLNSVQTALAARGRSIPTGSCPSVGIAGLTLGGGLGSDARRSGLMCDALASATVVLPSGETVKAAPDDHDDLYWALRGGGGGSVGVATAFTFATFPITDRDVVSLVFPGAATAQAIHGWHDWLVTAERGIWVMVNVTAGSDSGLRCAIVLATPPGGGPGAARDLSAAIGVQPVGNTSRTLSRMDFVHYFAGGDDATRPRAFVAGSDIVGEMTQAAAESIVAATAACPPGTGAATTVVESLDGAISDIGPGDTAFPWRRQAACVQWYTETPSPDSVSAANQWLAGSHQAVQPHSVGGYVGYVEPDTQAARYFGANLERLTAIRQRYDPQGLMYSGLSY
jgi:FAD/FMN-containing dehydrogenase